MIASFRQWEGFGHNANADLTDDPARIKWREFYELPQYGMVGAFEGAYMYARGIWRPETNSCMNNNVSYFNAPNRKKIVEPRAGELFVPFAPPVLTVGAPRR